MHDKPASPRLSLDDRASTESRRAPEARATHTRARSAFARTAGAARAARHPLLGAAAICGAVACGGDDGSDHQAETDAADGSGADVVDDGSGTADTTYDGSGGGGTGVQPDGAIVFGGPGSSSTAAGRGSFRFGAATAATQLEDQNTNTDWWYWTLPRAEGGLGKGTPVGTAIEGYTRALDDVQLVVDTHLDSYRFSVEWARVEPTRDAVDEAAVAHYEAVLDALVAAGVSPMVTLYHFSNPIWVNDFRTPCRDAAPTDANLCGWAGAGAPQVVDELVEHAALLAARYGHLVDDWCTINEPINYIVASYGAGAFPPGEFNIVSNIPRVLEVLRNYITAHARMYDAIKAADTVDADGDGVAASVGFTLSIADWVPARDNAPSADPADIEVARKVRSFYHEAFPRAALEGTLDTDLDGSPDETNEAWADRLDWLGVQYYFRGGVSAQVAPISIIGGTICFGTFDFGACLPPEEPTWWVPEMNYEFYAPGWYNVLRELADAFPSLPMIVTEGGISTRVGARRAENIVRTLEQVQRAIDDGIDVRGYYHWSLMDNFEWAEGYGPQFGLYAVDRETMARTPTDGQRVMADIAQRRTVTADMRALYGGDGPMTPEPEGSGE